MRHKKIKLQTQLIIMFLIISSIPAMIIMLMSIYMTTQSTQSIVDAFSRQINEQLNYNMNSCISNARSAMGDILSYEHVKIALSSYNKLDGSEQTSLRAEILQEISPIINTQDIITGVYLCENGNVCYSNLKVQSRFSIEDFEQSEVYKTMQKNGSTESYWFTMNEGQDLYLCRKAASGHNAYVVLGIDRKVISQLLELANVDMCMSILVVDQNNHIIMFEGAQDIDQEAILSKVQDTHENLEMQNIEDYVVSKVACTNGWTVIGIASMPKLMSDFNRSCLIIIAILGIVMLIIAIISIIFCKKITTPIRVLALNMKKVQDGDLEISKDCQKLMASFIYEIELLASGFINMVASLKNMVCSSKSVIKVAKTNTNALLNHSEQTSKSAQAINCITQEIAGGSLKQNNSINEVTQAVYVLSGQINNINNSITEIGEASKQTITISEETRQKLQELYLQSKQSLQTSQAVSVSVQALGDETKKINDIVAHVETINRKTNLLAINASIEAMRAGETGKGFMVVAEQMRQLSVQTKETISKITEVVEVIDKKRLAALKEMQKSEKIFDQQLPLVNEIHYTFDEIHTKMNQIDAKIENTHEVAHTITCQRKHIQAELEEVLQIAEISLNSIQAVTEKTMGQVEASNKINDLTKELLGVVNQLESKET